MKYLQNGGFQNNPYMRLTLSLALLFLVGFVITNFLIYFDRMDLSPESVVRYYNGSEEDFRPARTYQSMMEVTHMHLPMMAMVLLMLTHLVIFAPFTRAGKLTLILVPFLAGLLGEGSSWLVRFVHPGFAWLKIMSFVALQGSLIILLGALAMFLLRSGRNGRPPEERSEESPGLPKPHKHSEEKRRRRMALTTTREPVGSA
ncbi:MAG TPA: hypothetical protein VNN76_09695 [Bacteroidota bacterium]|nr:hypothetical protein [Bacteroidota bacterium]